VVPSWSESGYLSQQPVEGVAEARTVARAAGDHVARSSARLLPTQRVAETPQVASRRRRTVGLVAEEKQRQASSASDERAVGEQATQLGERRRKTRHVGRVHHVDDGVALAHVVPPQAPVATLFQQRQFAMSDSKMSLVL